MKVYSSSLKNYYAYKNMSLINAINEIIKGGFYDEKEKNEQKGFEQCLQKNCKQNKFA